MPARLILCCLAAALLVTGSAAAAPIASTSRAPTRLGIGLEAIVAAGAPGALALTRDTSGTTVLTAGTSELDGEMPIAVDQPFRVGSITKSFVAATALVLVRERRLRLDDTVDRWLPDVLPRGRKIAIRHLLQHTSGLADGDALLEPLVRDPKHAFTPMQVVRAATQAVPRFQPGRGWAYANVNYALLGLIIQKAAGKPLETVLQERIIVPLRLRQTVFPTNAEAPHGVVRGYLPHGNRIAPVVGGLQLDVTDTNPSWTWAAGALVSSAADVSRFYTALLDGRIVPRRLLGLMTQARPTPGGSGYGLGLLTVPTSCGPAFGHDGEIFGYTSLALTSADGSRSIVLFANASHPQDDGAILGAMLALGADALCNSTHT